MEIKAELLHYTGAPSFFCLTDHQVPSKFPVEQQFLCVDLNCSLDLCAAVSGFQFVYLVYIVSVDVHIVNLDDFWGAFFHILFIFSE